MDPFETFIAQQKMGWPHFAPLESHTTGTAARLVRHADIAGGQHVLDVACGTGVVAITAARSGARVTGFDLTPELLERARENASLANVAIEFHEGDVEQLPFPDESFDVVVSQFGHMFAPRPEVAIGQMLRVLKRGGTIAFSTWPPELLIGQLFMLGSRYLPPPPPGVSPPVQWGDPNIVRERLGSAVRDIRFARDTMRVPTLSPQHHRAQTETTAAPLRRLVETLEASDPARLETFRREYEALASQYLIDNFTHQGYLMTRATKV
jgi:SAM-dependent methyltransferase